MTKSLLQVKKDLKAFAKRCKDFKYTDSALFTFLLCGMLLSVNLFSAATTDSSIENQVQKINTSISQIRTNFKRAKIENNKLIKGTNLELIQLMEQGDQVVKDPFANWQFGINYFHSNWGGTYKGRGNKTKNVIYQRDPNNKFGNYTGADYGRTFLKRVIEPISAIPVDAAVKPKNIQKTALNINLPTIGAPSTPNLNISVKAPAEVAVINPALPEIEPELPTPNTNPFSDFTFTDGFWNRSSLNDTGKIFWAGYKPGTGYAQGFGNSAGVNVTNQRTGVLIYIGNGTPKYGDNGQNKIYVHAAGNVSTAGKSGMYGDSATYDGRAISQQQHSIGYEHDGQIAFHLFGKTSLENIEVDLYGKANAFSLETWQMHNWTFNNVDVKIVDDGTGIASENVIFNIYPSPYETTLATWNLSNRNRGKFIGSVNADLTTKKNIVYSVVGNAGSFVIDTNHGIYNLEGSGNTFYSGLGYQANYGKMLGGTGTTIGAQTSSNSTGNTETDWKPYMNFDASKIRITGDENIGLFFSDNVHTNTTPYASGSHDNWNKSVIGIYQGEIKAGAVIGQNLQIDTTKTTQTTQGNTGTILNSNKWVEKNVGILAASGQRSGIEATRDLGATAASTNGNDFSKDIIHALEINEANFTFGKYSKEGVGIVAKNGTQVDVLESSNAHVNLAINQNVLTDFGVTTSSSVVPIIVSENQTVNQAGTGTIMALAQGKWSDSTRNMTMMSTTTTNALKNFVSEINIGTDVEMASKYHDFTTDKGKEIYAIAYAALDNGIVTAKGKTTAHGYGTIIGYAKDGGTIKAEKGDIKATSDWATTDANTKKYTYHNVGGYAVNSAGGTSTTVVNLGNGTASTPTAVGNTTTIINGLGGYADGENTEVNLKGTTNINTGASGALVAKNKGVVNYYGGTITHKNNGILGTNVNDHDNTTPFYATDNGKVKFQDKTILNMYDGVLITGEDTDYSSTIGGSEKYQGLQNVKVEFKSDNVTMGSFSGKTLTWDDSTDTSLTFRNALPGIAKFNNGGTPGGGIHLNGHTYKTILTNGTLNVTAPTVTLDSSSDQYNGIVMANEMVTISNATTVSGDVSQANIKGQGLSMGNLPTATQLAATPPITPSNATSGLKNEGTVNVTGGTTANGIAGMNVSYGTIKNGTSKGSTATVTIDNGAGIYGTNGSKLENFGTINVTGSGAGIAARGTDKNTKQYYGTDDANFTYTPYTINIENHGAINVAGNNPVGIYAENNTQAGRDKVIVKNDSQLTVGNDGVGITVLSSPIETGQKQGTPPVSVAGVNHGAGSDQGGTITVTAFGAGSDIITGVNGKGIYAEDSDINLTGGDYVIETKEKGIGIFASGDTNVNGTLEYKYNGSSTGTGMGIVYDQDGQPTKTNRANVKLNNAANTTGGMIGLYTTAGTGNTFINQGDITGTSSALEFGIVSNGADVINDAGHKIKLGNATTQANANVGIYSKAKNKTVNKGSITVGDNAIGIYGYDVDNENGALIKAGDNGVAIYTHDTGTNVNLNSGSTITLGGNQAVGVYAVGSNQNLNANAGATMNIGDDSFGFVDAGTGNTVTSKIGNVSLGNDSIYVYQNDNTGKVFNYTSVTSTGNKNYGLYGNGTMENRADIDFSIGAGNVAIYSTGGTATNFNLIKVGASNTANKEFGVGMATGYYDEATHAISNQGTVINRGTIEVSKPNTMGMYAVGSGSKAINYGDINLSGSNTIGMYLDRGAVGENWGTIKTTASGLRAVKGIYLANGSYIKNYGTITIGASDMKSAGIWADTQSAAKAQENAAGTNPTTGTSQTGASNLSMRIVTADDMKEMGGVTIKVPPRSTAVTVTDANGNVIPIVNVDTNTPLPSATLVTVTSPSGITTLDLSTIGLGSLTSASEATSLGMYVDTSGVNYTNPIQGISNLAGLEDINLFFGSEAAKYTTAKAIEIGDNILKPYNDALAPIVTAGTTLNSTAASLTWMAQPTKNAATGLLDKVYLVKIPYTTFAKAGDTQTYNFLAGLEERYGVEGLGTKEKSIFDKLNSLTGGEGHILAQAIDEMKGHQYSNIQQRMFETGRVLSKEFNYLQDEWRNPSKNSNKIKVFGQRGEFKTDTAGVVDYTNNAYGVAYVHENEKIKLGNKSGWYAGSVYNKFKFKDIGKSQEEQTMIKAGVFKTMSPKKDYNGSLTWKIAGEAFAGRGDMKRRYWIVDEVFEAKGKYTTYGVALKNEIGKEFRTSENTSIRPYGALNLEYGKYSDFRETGPMALKVKGNDYFSAKPEAGISFNYKQDLGVRSKLTASLTAAYENELGELYDVQNKAKLKGTKAPYYKLRGDKENHRGNGKFDLNFGWDNTRFGVTVNAGYDTTGENFRGGIGFRAIY